MNCIVSMILMFLGTSSSGCQAWKASERTTISVGILTYFAYGNTSVCKVGVTVPCVGLISIQGERRQ